MPGFCRKSVDYQSIDLRKAAPALGEVRLCCNTFRAIPIHCRGIAGQNLSMIEINLYLGRIEQPFVPSCAAIPARHGWRRPKGRHMKKLKYGASLIAMAGLVAPMALAQDAPAEPAAAKRLQTVTITATKRTESAQDVPVAVTALGEQQLKELGVKNFSDYLVQLPGVTAGGSGPGQNIGPS